MLVILCLAAPLRAEPTREELKREAKDLREMGECAEKRKPPKRPQAKNVSKGDR